MEIGTVEELTWTVLEGPSKIKGSIRGTWVFGGRCMYCTSYSSILALWCYKIVLYTLKMINIFDIFTNLVSVVQE